MTNDERSRTETRFSTLKIAFHECKTIIWLMGWRVSIWNETYLKSEIILCAGKLCCETCVMLMTYSRVPNPCATEQVLLEFEFKIQIEIVSVKTTFLILCEQCGCIGACRNHFSLLLLFSLNKITFLPFFSSMPLISRGRLNSSLRTRY